VTEGSFRKHNISPFPQLRTYQKVTVSCCEKIIHIAPVCASTVFSLHCSLLLIATFSVSWLFGPRTFPTPPQNQIPNPSHRQVLVDFARPAGRPACGRPACVDGCCGRVQGVFATAATSTWADAGGPPMVGPPTAEHREPQPRTTDHRRPPNASPPTQAADTLVASVASSRSGRRKPNVLRAPVAENPMRCTGRRSRRSTSPVCRSSVASRRSETEAETEGERKKAHASLHSVFQIQHNY
jgi:hypothetical protein